MTRTARQKQRQSASQAEWARRHPEKARDERRLRKQRAADLEQFGHKRHGTPETHAKAAQIRQGALARLYQSGAIDAEQLAASVEIAAIHARITGEARLRTISLETRVDTSPNHDGSFFEALGAVRAEMAYGRWRRDLAEPMPVLAMIVDDLGLAGAARRYGMHHRRCRRLLTGALDSWRAIAAAVRREVRAADLAAMQAGLV